MGFFPDEGRKSTYNRGSRHEKYYLVSSLTCNGTCVGRRVSHDHPYSWPMFTSGPTEPKQTVTTAFSLSLSLSATCHSEVWAKASFGCVVEQWIYPVLRHHTFIHKITTNAVAFKKHHTLINEQRRDLSYVILTCGDLATRSSYI
jgi:hypothetical protein